MENGVKHMNKKIILHPVLTSLEAFSNLAHHLHPQWLEAVCINLLLCGSNIERPSI